LKIENELAKGLALVLHPEESLLWFSFVEILASTWIPVIGVCASQPTVTLVSMRENV
jgi:hypothetical protein